MTDTEIATYIIDQFEAGTPPGKVSDDAVDFGGITRWGITRPYAAEFLRTQTDLVPKEAIRGLTREKAIEMLLEVDLRRSGVWAIPDWRVRFVVVDFNFNAGSDDGTPTLQRLVGVKVDGKIGPLTLAAVEATDPQALAARVIAERLKFHARKSGRGVPCIVCKLPSQKKWLGGWVNRCAQQLHLVMS